jgi:gamma-tubulin complex component 5
MAPSTTIGSLTDELVTSLITTRTPVSKVRKLKDTFNKQLRHHNHARTNQFEVAGRLDGLQEKFLILNRDDLADALHACLRELKTATPSDEKWLPDVLHLLLQLSRDPAQKTKVDDVTKEKPLVEIVRPLRWAEVEVEDPIDRGNKIWANPDLSDLSSDEDVFIAPSEPSSPGARQKDEHADDVSHENAYLVDRELERKDDEHPAPEQIWNADADTEIVITELQAVRETLFMLQGLPTTLFWRVGHTIEVDKRFRLNHASLYLLRDILKSFTNIGLRVDLVRTWLKEPQTVPFMQSLRVGVEQKILDFDSCVSQMQSQLLPLHQSTVVSLAKTFDDIIEHSKVIMHLASFFEQVMVAAADSIECLDLLYTTVCSCQASGAEDLFEPLSHLFIKVFEVYLEPVLRWIEFGELDSSLKSTIVDNSIHQRSLPGLWQEWYNLNSHPGSSRTPRFMQQLVHQIFLAGKTQVFLRHLPNTGQSHPSKPTALTIVDIRLIQPSSLLPFSEAFEVVIKRAIEGLHRSSSAELREKLAHECGLWRTLDALHSIFLGRSGWAIDAVDARIFDRIDRGNRAWNDRYLLTELYRNTLEGIDSIDTQRITVQTGRASSRDMQSQRRSVKMLENIIVTYSLPWPVANIISDGALQSYKRVSTFLFQIRRARYVLERRCRVAVMSERLDISLAEQRLAQKIHSQLLIFVNYLYDHLALFTIEHTTGEMRQALTEAIDVDGMIQVYQSYISKLEDMCLVSRRVSAIKRAVLTVMDLCIRFSDTVTSPLGQRTSVDAQSFKSAASRLRDQYKTRGTDGSSSDEDSSDSEGFSTFITFDESSYESELSHIKQEFDRHRSFLVAGLESFGRVEEQNTGWDVLAERLGWKASMKP